MNCSGYARNGKTCPKEARYALVRGTVALSFCRAHFDEEVHDILIQNSELHLKYRRDHPAGEFVDAYEVIP